MNSISARRIASDHVTRSTHSAVANGKRQQKRSTLKAALRRIKYENTALLRSFMRNPRKPRGSMKMSKSGLLMAAGALSVAAGTLPLDQFDHQSRSAALEAENARKHSSGLMASDELKQAILEEEGVRFTVYRDVAGNPTVGAGHLVIAADGLNVGDTISKRRALAFLSKDIARAERGARDLAGHTAFNQHEFDALVDLVYNVGAGTVSKAESPQLNEAIGAKNYTAIAGELDYGSAEGRAYRGLQIRSNRRASIFLDGEYADPREA